MNTDKPSPEADEAVLPVLDYARPRPVKLPAQQRNWRVALMLGFFLSGAAILLGLGLLIMAAMLLWSSMEIRNGESSGMMVGGFCVLQVGGISLFLGLSGQRSVRRLWRGR